ncbi:aspartate aminotransferase family protein [Polaromonas sp.]|uniref:aspartate aminotransferase family protein n=1 Tax=Polaromonas sp. TaxID=1869339 RepID=UPI0025DB59EF|nr:aspartate aminotransferase family protein [Polaromonas sp.]
MPFTPNRKFKQSPRFIVGSEGLYYDLADGRRVLDAIAGLWCVNAGHRNPRVSAALKAQIDVLDYASNFQIGHTAAFELAERLTQIAPAGMNHVFFTNSGSESVDTALKIALAYHRARGDAGRYRLIGRERSYHGVSFGGISVGGIGRQRSTFGPLLNGVDHLPHTHDLGRNAFSRGEPAHGLDKADTLEAMLTLHDASTVAAVIVEPVAGSAGVLPPPSGYLKRLREICDKHGVLLIFDEVITGFGRLGANFAANLFDVAPDIITTAKGLTNGAVPMGAVLMRDAVHDAFMQGSVSAVELSHGYTYSGHPLACAAAMATLDAYFEDGLIAQAAALSPYFEDTVHSLRGLPGVIDIRNVGLLGGIELQPWADGPGTHAQAVAQQCLDRGVLVRAVGDTIALSPPFTMERKHIDQIVDSLRAAITQTAQPTDTPA